MRLCSEKDGLVPDVMNSVEWQAKLWAIQQDAGLIQMVVLIFNF